MKTYLYKKGIEELSSTLEGNEKIHVGIRPYELHAGNILSIAVYPYLLCEAMKLRRIEPSFTIYVSINDWEQEELIGKDIYNYIFDTRPKHTTIKYGKCTDGTYLADAWQPKIEHEVCKIKESFPGVRIKFIRNSSLRNKQAMKKVILHTIRHRKLHKNMLLDITKKKTLGEDMYFANAICPVCLHANTNSEVVGDTDIKIRCNKCGLEQIAPYNTFDYWLYHKQLFTARLAIFKYDLAISGGDHYKEGDSTSREKLYELITSKKAPELKMLYAPILIAKNGAKMSKSRNNYEYASFEDVLDLARCSDTSEIVFK